MPLRLRQEKGVMSLSLGRESQRAIGAAEFSASCGSHPKEVAGFRRTPKEADSGQGFSSLGKVAVP